jgi:hypothetical protein
VAGSTRTPACENDKPVKTKWLALIRPARRETEAAEQLALRVRPYKIRPAVLPAHLYVLRDEPNLIAFEAEARRLHLVGYRVRKAKVGYVATVPYPPNQEARIDALDGWTKPYFVSDGTTPSYEYVFWDEPSFVAFKAEAAALGFDDPWNRKELIYSRPEIMAAPLLDLHLRTAERGDSRPCGGTKFDFTKACPGCGTGAVQASPAMLRRSELRYDRKCEIFQTFTDFFVSPQLADGLKEARVNGLELRQAINIADGSPLPWYQLIASTTLPPLSALTSGTKRQNPCGLCGMNGYYHSGHEPLVLAYERESVVPESLPDVVATFEWFGYWELRDPIETSVLGSPLLLLKPKVVEVFERFKVRRVRFSPVKFVS